MHSVSKNLQRDEEPGERVVERRPLQGAFLIPPVLPVVLIVCENMEPYPRVSACFAHRSPKGSCRLT